MDTSEKRVGVMGGTSKHEGFNRALPEGVIDMRVTLGQMV